MNILVLTMSKFIGKEGSEGIEINPSNYTYKLRKPLKKQLGRINFSGYGQLEPVTITLIWKLVNKGDKLDCVLVINNDETYDNKYDVCLQNKKGLQNEKEKYQNTSAYEFLVERVKNYPFEDVEFIYEEGYSSIVADKITSKAIPIFISKKVDYRNPISGVADICNELRKLYDKSREKSEPFNLFLDIHGGIRSQQINVDAILSLLVNEGIRISETYSVEGSLPNFTIINADESIRILYFVSGMNEFLNYGRSKSLLSYFNDDLGSQKDEDRKLVDAISKVSESLQLCRMDEFGIRLGNLREAIGELSGEKNSELMTFATTIKNDYRELLKDENNIPAQLKWCLRHEFLQQALTIIESMIPSYILDMRVIWYEYLNEIKETDKLTDNTSKEKNKERKIYIQLSIQEKGKEERKKEDNVLLVDFIRDSRRNKWVESENYLFEQCTRKVQNNNSSIPLELEEGYYYKIPYRWYKNGDKKLEEVVPPPKYENCFEILKSSDNHNPKKKWKSNISLVVEEKNKEMFNRMLQLHWALKNQRNLANHARPVEQKENDNQNHREDVANIKLAIKVYSDMLDKLICLCER